MATASLGKLEVTFAGDTTSLDAAANKAKNSMKGAENASQKMATSISSSFRVAAAAAVAAGLIIHTAAESMAAAARSAQSLGLAVETFSSLSFAARNAGVSAEGLNDSIRQLSQRLSNVDPMSETTRALQALGLAYDMGTTKGFKIESTLLAVADKFASMKDGVNKTAIAMALFGEQGVKLIPFLNKGAAGIKELQAEADRLGITLTGESSKAAIAYSEKLETVKAIVAGVAKSMTNQLLPAINSAMDGFIKFAKELEIVKVSGKAVDGIISGLSVAYEALMLPVRAAGVAIVAFFEAAGLAGTGKFGEALERLKTGITEVQISAVNSATKAAQALGVLNTSAEQTAAKWGVLSVEMAKKDAPAIVSAYELNRALQERKALYVSMQQDITTDNTKTNTDKIAALTVMVRTGAMTWREYVAAVRSINDADSQNALKVLMENKTLPMTDRVAELNAMLDRGKIGVLEYADNLKTLNEAGAASMDALASTTSQALTTIFTESKSAAIAAALINTYQAITKTLATYAPPVSYVMAGLQAAMGFAQVQKIRSTSKSGGGGGSSGSSGAGAAAAATAAAPAQQESTLTVRGLSMNGLFTGEAVRDIASKLLDFQRDGGRVVLAGA